MAIMNADLLSLAIEFGDREVVGGGRMRWVVGGGGMRWVGKDVVSGGGMRWVVEGWGGG